MVLAQLFGLLAFNHISINLEPCERLADYTASCFVKFELLSARGLWCQEEKVENRKTRKTFFPVLVFLCLSLPCK